MENIKKFLEQYTGSMEVTAGPYYKKDVKCSLLEKEGNLILNIGEDKISLFTPRTDEDLKDIYSWSVFDGGVRKEGVIKCLLFNKKIKNEVTYKGESKELGYKIITSPDEVLIHWELFISNITKILNVNKLSQKIDSYFKYCEDLVKSKSICVLEITNLEVLDQKFIKDLEKSPLDFLRTNLVIINEGLNAELSHFDIESDFNIELVTEPNLRLSHYSFKPELLCFLESAEKLDYPHLKFIDYYHVLEYFLTDFAYKELESSIQELVSKYLGGGTYEDFRNAILTLNEKSEIFSKEKDLPLLNVLKQVPANEIADIINKNKLFKLLKEDIFSIPRTRLITDNIAKPNINSVEHIKIPEEDYDKFYERLHRRFYSIRNSLIHSKAKFKGKEELEFLPVAKFENKLLEDVVLIKELSIRICKKLCCV